MFYTHKSFRLVVTLFLVLFSTVKSVYWDSSLSDSFICQKNQNGITYLTREDFADGTYRIRKSGIYAFSADIVFNPDSNLDEPNNVNSYFPINLEDNFPGSSTNVKAGPFKLGWFAGITVEVDDVQINLCGHSLRMSKAFYLQQRFYSNIEIGNAAFFHDQGPFFNGDGVAVKNVAVKYGVLGLSSHHGIHSNQASNVLIKDLLIRNFEVAGIQFNGFTDIQIRDVEIGPSSTQAYAAGKYSNARYLLLPFLRMAARIPNEVVSFSDGVSMTVSEIFEELEEQMDYFFKTYTNNLDLNSIKQNPIELEDYEKAIELFSTENSLPDGAALYGIVLHSPGEATQGFGESFGSDESSGAILENIIIHNLQLNTKEFVGYKQSDNEEYVTGPYGDAIDLKSVIKDFVNEDITDKLDELEFEGNILIYAQLALGHLNVGGGEAGKTLKMIKNGDFLDWALNGDALEGSITCNQDAMRHLNKGIIGIRIEESNSVDLINVEINSLDNWSEKGTLACGDYSGPDNGGHESQDKWIGYSAGDSRGISVWGSENVKIENIIINDVNSLNGDAKGIDIIQDSEVKFIGPILIDEISAGDCFDTIEDMSVNQPPIACGLIDSSNNVVSGENIIQVFNIEGCNICESADESFEEGAGIATATETEPIIDTTLSPEESEATEIDIPSLPSVEVEEVTPPQSGYR